MAENPGTEGLEGIIPVDVEVSKVTKIEVAKTLSLVLKSSMKGSRRVGRLCGED